MIPRESPIIVPEATGRPVAEDQLGWAVVQAYEPVVDSEIGLVDLSHRPKALVCGPAVQKIDISTPGQALWDGQAWTGFISRDKAVVFRILGSMEANWPDWHYTDMTDGWALFGLFGTRAPQVIGRLTSIDVEKPEINGPAYMISQSHAIGCQIINPKGYPPGYLIACDRSYGQNFYDNCMQGGAELGLSMLGVKAFEKWVEDLDLH